MSMTLYQNKSNPQRIHILALKHYIKLVERIKQKIGYGNHHRTFSSLKKNSGEFHLRFYTMGASWVTRDGQCRFPQSADMALPLRVASHSAVFCA